MVTVSVDDDDDGPKKFDIHVNLLSHHSNFFWRAIETHDGSSGELQIVHAPESHHGAFKIFVQFIYTGGVYLAASEEEQYAALRAGYDDEYSRISQCWGLDEAIASTSFKDAVTDTLISKIVEWRSVPSGVHRDIYPLSHAGSPIRRLLIDIAVYLWTTEDIDQWDDFEEQGDEFIFDLMKELHRTKGTVVAKPQALQDSENTCAYHEHVAEGTPCYKKIF